MARNKKKCAVSRCFNGSDMMVRYEIQIKDFGYKTDWLCIDHAIGELNFESRKQFAGKLLKPVDAMPQLKGAADE